MNNIIEKIKAWFGKAKEEYQAHEHKTESKDAVPSAEVKPETDSAKTVDTIKAEKPKTEIVVEDEKVTTEESKDEVIAEEEADTNSDEKAKTSEEASKA